MTKHSSSAINTTKETFNKIVEKLRGTQAFYLNNCSDSTIMIDLEEIRWLEENTAENANFCEARKLLESCGDLTDVIYLELFTNKPKPALSCFFCVVIGIFKKPKKTS